MKNLGSSWLAGAGLLAALAFGSALPAFADDDSTRAPWPAGPLRNMDDALKRHGISSSLTYIGETLGAVSGGTRRGIVYDGRLDFAIDADLQKLVGWTGAKFHASVINDHGDALSRGYIGNLMTVSNIEAVNHTRLYDLWVEQSFGNNFSLRVGQFGADVEFDNSKYTGSLLNATFGWPPLSGVDLPAGGPVFPLSTLGVRAKANLSDKVTLLLAMFDGNAAGPGTEDPQNLDSHGLNFRLRDSPLMLAELQYAYQLDAKRPGTLKLGAWMHTGDFHDQRYDAHGVPIANPASTGIAGSRSGSFAPYAVIEQMLLPLDSKGEKGVGAFARVNGTQSDRNQIDFYADAGLNITGFWNRRPNDSISVGVGYARISSAARGYDQDLNAFGMPTAVRDYEAVFEATYSAQIAKGWTLQPDFQYIMHPNGGGTDPNSTSGRRIPDAIVIGARMTVQFGNRNPNSQQ